jgi:membrane fusion protein (multidrug efflux system)
MLTRGRELNEGSAMGAPDSSEPAGKSLRPSTVSSPTSDAQAPAVHPQSAKPAETPTASRRRWWIWIAGAALLLLAVVEGVPWLITALTTVSTDDAYVNGHVTFVAPRVPGQVTRVLVDDNNRVKMGDLLVQLDKEPYEVEVSIAQAAVETAQANLVAAQADIRALMGQARSQRFELQHAIEDLDNRVAELQSRVATLESQKAILTRARADYEREKPLVKQGAVSKQEFDEKVEALSVAEAQLDKTQHDVYEVRVALGLPRQPGGDGDLAAVPPDLDQTFSGVKQAQFRLMQTAAQLGVAYSFDTSPKQMLADFYRRDPEGNIDRIYAQLLKDAPAVKQAEGKLGEAQSNLDQANLNLRYCDVLAEIDGVVTRRNVNPGDHVVAGQAMMALRSLTEIWIDANFKETQLAKLRIGQAVDVDVDMYGGKERFQGRISGFTMGTGSTLALLPAENATGNFVKVVQRLPVRIELQNYDPDTMPLFVGLSVTPYVHVNEAPTGPDAGKILQLHVADSNAAPPDGR